MKRANFQQLVKSWSELEEASIPLEPLENRVGTGAPGAAITIRPGRNRWLAEIRELKNERFAFIVPIFIRRNLPGKTIIRDAWIGTSWPDGCIEALEDSAHDHNHPGYYEFPYDTERFPREKVINHRLPCTLARGEIREGLFLAVGSRPPENVKNHDEIEITFHITDQWDGDHVAKIEMRINRRPIRVAPLRASTRSGLLSRRDKLTAPRSMVAPPFEPVEDFGDASTEEQRQALEEVNRAHRENNRP
jgi:hypothetical protein